MTDRSKDKRVEPLKNENKKMLASAMNLLFQSMLKAEMNDDPSSLARLSKEIRELSKLIPDFSPTPDPEWSDEQFEKSVSLNYYFFLIKRYDTIKTKKSYSRKRSTL